MGSFEKLGILVIVVIIVMILAVAIYQWGGTEGPDDYGRVLKGPTPPMSVLTNAGGGSNRGAAGAREVEYINREESGRDARARGTVTPTKGNWPGGIPKNYTIRSGDNLWKLVVKKWHLKESFTGAIARENPKVTVAHLRVGQRIRIPNPDSYRRGRGASSRNARPVGKSPRKLPKGVRIYEVQEGDMFGSIAHEQLGSVARTKEIMDLNPGVKPSRLRPGQKLYIPAR